MDPENTILGTARQKVGCNGLRNYGDLGKLRQDTLERRFNAARQALSMSNMGSVYAMWLQDQLNRIGGFERTKAVRAFCKFLHSWGYTSDKAVELWNGSVVYACGSTPQDKWLSFIGKTAAVARDIQGEFSTLRTRPDPPISTNPGILKPMDGNKPQTSKPTPFQPAQQPTNIKQLTSPIRQSKPLDLDPYSSHTAQQRTRAKTPASPCRKKNKDLFVIDLTKDKWDKTSKVDFVKGSTRCEAVPKVPKNYVCKRCGVKGHFVQDCPKNQDPAWDSRPHSRYICRACGAKGEHFLTSCPKVRAKQLSKSPSPQHPTPSTQKDKDDCFDQGGRRDDTKGRLSPWDNTPGEQILYEAAELPYDQNEIDATHSARDFLERLSEDLVPLDHAAVSQSPELRKTPNVQRPSDDSPPKKKQKVLPLRPQTGDSLSSRSGSDDREQDPDQTFDSTICSMRMEVDSARSPWSRSPSFYSSLSPRSPENIEPVVPYFTLKSLGQYPPYDDIVHDLFLSRRNFWVKTSSRPTALDLWDRREY